MKNTSLILVRHGQSEWNEKNLFTGWENPGLTQKGEKEAKDAGKIINGLGINFDYLYTSALIRAQLTGSIILSEINQKNVNTCLLYTSPSPRDVEESRMPSSA